MMAADQQHEQVLPFVRGVGTFTSGRLEQELHKRSITQ